MLTQSQRPLLESHYERAGRMVVQKHKLRLSSEGGSAL